MICGRAFLMLEDSREWGHCHAISHVHGLIMLVIIMHLI